MKQVYQMRILHIIPSIPKSRGGPSQAIIEMVKALRKTENLEVEIATTNDNGKSLLNVPLQKKVVYQGVPIYFFHRFSPKNHKIREYAFSSQLTRWFWHEIHKYDLIHIHAIFSYLPTAAMLISRLKNKKYIVQPHGLLCNWALEQNKHQKNIYLKLIEKQNLKNSSGLIFTSEKESCEALANFKKKIFNITVPLGLKSSTFLVDRNASKEIRSHYNISFTEPIILFLSRLHEVKGLEYLIPALAKVKDYPFNFIIAGSGTEEYEAEVKALLDKFDMWDKTHMIGFVEGDVKNLLLQGSDLFILTSKLESFGVAVLEALSVGLPVLVTPGVALASVVKDNQLGYVSDLDVNEIADNVRSFLDNPEQAVNISDRASKFVQENYTWDKIALQMIDVYQEVLKARI